VNIVAPAAHDEKGYILVNGKTAEILLWEQGTMSPMEVHITYNHEVQKLDTAEIRLMLMIYVDLDGGKTKDARFINTEQSAHPVDIILLPSLHNTAGAKSLLVQESAEGTSVAEGSNGFPSSYDVYLRPCSTEMLEAVHVQISATVPDQIAISPSVLTGTHFMNDECKTTVWVSALDDDFVEGDHYTSIIHKIQNSTSGGHIWLSDGSPLKAPNVLVTIYDDDTPGIIVEESFGVTVTTELSDSGKAHVDEVTHYQDEYFIRLTKQPVGPVHILLDNTLVLTDLETSGRDFSKRKQVLVNGAESNSITFTTEDWFHKKKITVTAIDDNIEEGVDVLNFASQASNLGRIQGPLVISGGNSPATLDLAAESPIVMPHEFANPLEFIIPHGVVIDISPRLVYEENQVDAVIFNHMDAKGYTEGTLQPTKLLGIGMVQDLFLLGNGPFSGIMYDGVELVTLNLGNESNQIFVNDTSEAIHVINLDSNGGLSNDNVVVTSLSGPLLINGGGGQDTVQVSSEQAKLNTIGALLMYDGGEGQDGDRLVLDNSGDFDQDNTLNVTRLTVDVHSMKLPQKGAHTIEKNPILPRESFLVTLRNTAGVLTGSFSFNISDPTSETRTRTVELPYPSSAQEMELALESALIPDPNSCGMLSTSLCSSSVKVLKLGSETFVIFFLGEKLNSGVSLELNTASLENFNGEIFLNATNNFVLKNHGVAYTNLERLEVKMGHQDIVTNIRGTSAVDTFITTQEGNDKFFIASDANEDNESAASVAVLHGLLDYIDGNLHIESKSGNHMLLISDSLSTVSKGVGNAGFAILSNSSLTNLGEHIGNIYFSSSGGNWWDDVTLWLGKGDDKLNVVSIPVSGYPSRTTTSVHAGEGRDVVHINLIESENSGGLFIANGQVRVLFYYYYLTNSCLTFSPHHNRAAMMS
jgi:hypothetical protein